MAGNQVSLERNYVSFFLFVFFFFFFFVFFFFFFSKLLLKSIQQSQFDFLALNEPKLFHLNLYKQLAYPCNWRQVKLLGRWETNSLPLLWLSFCFRFSIVNSHPIPSDNTVQIQFNTVHLFSSWLKRPKCSFTMAILGAFFIFGTHRARTLLTPFFRVKTDVMILNIRHHCRGHCLRGASLA